MKNDRYLLWADILKLASLYAVILIHSAAPLLVRYNRIDASAWWIGNLYDSFARWCIPVFFMLSGAFLLTEAGEVSAGRFFQKRFQRVVVPLFVWSGIYFIWRIAVNGEDLAFGSFFLLFLRGPIYYHLWFLYVLVGLYLLAPILGVYVKNAGRRNVGYFLALWFLFGSAVPTIESALAMNSPYALFSRDSVFNYVGYFMLGYFLRATTLGAAKKILFAIVFLAAFFMTAYGTYYATAVLHRGVFQNFLYDYYSVNVLIMAIAVYLVAKSAVRPSFSNPGGRGAAILRAAALCVPGMYLIHTMPIAVFKQGMLGIAFTETTLHPALGIPLFSLCVFIGSFVPIFIIKRIPGLRHVVP